MQTALQDYLEESKFNTEEATSGEEGLKIFFDGKPNLILLDVEMPGIDGFETCRRIRRAPGGQHVPIVMMTGHEDAESVNRAYDAGATDFVSKPINFEVLVHRLRHLLKTTETSAELMRSQASLAQAQRIAKLGSWYFDIKKLEFCCTDEAAKLIRPDRPQKSLPLLSFLRAVSEEDRADYKTRFMAALTAETNFDIDFKLSYKSGSRDDDEIYIHQETSIEFDEQGNPIRAIGTFQDITEAQATQNRIKQLAYFDVVTGLPNRSSFMEELADVLDDAHGSSKKMALMFVDVDQFKRINDTWGHHVGDELLIQVARRLSESLRAEDLVRRIHNAQQHTLARLGGDEFVVLLSHINTKEEAAIVAERLIDTLKQPFLIEDMEIHVSASVGVSCYPDDGEDEQTLLQHADTAMYQVKEQGRNAFRFYDRSMSNTTLDRLNLENSLRRAIEENEFELFYQAKVSTESQRIIGAEALLRWRHPDLGLVEPGYFISTAEECGLIVPIGSWVLKQSCSQFADWREKLNGNYELSINTAAIELRQPGFLDGLKNTLAEYEIPPKKFLVEITESMLIDQADCSKNLLAKIRQLGVRIAIDDFGTGYSSLKYLKDLPVTNVKIDRSFVSEMENDSRDAGIVEATIALAHHLGMTVTAEGVENIQQLKLLEKFGCDELQGYHFCKPLSADRFESRLTEQEFGPHLQSIAAL